MKIIIRFFLILWLGLTMVSCQLNFEATFHKDKTTSVEISMKIDDSMLDEINLDRENPDSREARTFKGLSPAELPTEWTTFYDFSKRSGGPLPKSRDSVTFLKSVMVKFDADGEQFKGFAMKINRAGDEELKYFSQLFQDVNPGKDANKQNNKELTMLDMKWDGKKLIIPTGEDPVAKEVNDPGRDTTQTKAKESLNFFKTAFRGANFVVAYKFTFESRIREIRGEHEFIKKLDDHIVEFKIDMMKIMEAEAEGKKIKKLDEEVVIFVE